MTHVIFITSLERYLVIDEYRIEPELKLFLDPSRSLDAAP